MSVTLVSVYAKLMKIENMLIEKTDTLDKKEVIAAFEEQIKILDYTQKINPALRNECESVKFFLNQLKSKLGIKVN